MKMVRRLLTFIALLALGFWLWSLLFAGPEKLIRKQLDAVAEVASFAGREGPLTMARNAAKLAGYFSLDAQVTFEAPGHGQQTLSGRNEIQQTALGARSAIGSLAVEFLDMNVTLTADKQSATADLTVRAKVGGEASSYVQEMKFVFKKIEGRWLIARVETVKTLSRATAEETTSLSSAGGARLSSAAARSINQGLAKSPVAGLHSGLLRMGTPALRLRFLALVTCHLSPV